MKLSTSIGKIIGGNVILAFLIASTIFMIYGRSEWLHLLVSSVIFGFLTILVIIWTHYNVVKKKHPQELFLTNGLALIRMIISISYLLLYREWHTGIESHIVLSFILIYVYYLIVDVFYLSRLVSN